MTIKRCYSVLVGATVRANQLVENGDFSDGLTRWSASAGTMQTIEDGALKIQISQAGGYGAYRAIPVVAGHTNLNILQFKGKNGGTYWTNGVVGVITGTGDWQTIYGIERPSGNNRYLNIADRSTSDFQPYYAKNIMTIDLTDHFGSASIADYLYSLETATAGAGVAKLKEWGFFTGEYIPYNPGTLESVEATAHKMVGFNQWDEVWELGAINSSNGTNTSDSTRIRTKNYIHVLPDTNYFFGIENYSGQVGTIVFYDADKNFVQTEYTPANTVLKTPKNIEYMRIGFYVNYGTTYNNDICINLSNPDRNGEYEPYTSQTYALGSDTLRGIFKLDANNNLYADGDRKESDGTITRYYGTRAYQEGDESLADAITDGTTTVYKLSSPTTEISTPFTSPQVCYPDGTEEFVTENGVPVGHETKYQL